MKGVTCIERNGSVYWYARTDGHRVYCGQGDKGKKLAEAGRAKYVTKQYENREMNAGLNIKRSSLRPLRTLPIGICSYPRSRRKKAIIVRLMPRGICLDTSETNHCIRQREVTRNIIEISSLSRVIRKSP